MAILKASAVAEQAGAGVGVDDTAKAANPAKYASHRPEVKGQVAMHAIITGYKVGAALGPILAASPKEVLAEVDRIAEHVAAKIEARTFQGD